MHYVSNRFPGKRILRTVLMAVLLLPITISMTTITISEDCSHRIVTPGKMTNHDSNNEIQTLSSNEKLTAGITEELNQLYSEETTYVSSSPMVVDIVTQGEQERENKLYYVYESHIRTDLDIEYQDYLYQMCVEYDIPEHYTLLLAQMYHESGFDVNAVSSTDDYGLMQINVFNHEWLREKLGISNFLDPYDNIKAGTFMMSQFLKKYDDVQKALVCYNRGEGAVKKGTYSTSYSEGVLYDMTLLVEIESNGKE